MDEKKRPLHERMIAFIQSREPLLMSEIKNVMVYDASVITWQNVEDIVFNKFIDNTITERWRIRLAKFVSEKLSKQYGEVIQYALKNIQLNRQNWMQDWIGAMKWITNHGAQLTVNLATSQVDAIKQILALSMKPEMNLSAMETSYLIRPIIGLTPKQATSVANYYNDLKRAGYTEVRALSGAQRYAKTTLNARALTIARTELAYAYNEGSRYGVQQAIDQGLTENPMYKIWSTAADERVCDICGPMDGVKVKFEESFSVMGDMIDTPPAHPNCRCAVMYVEQGDREYNKIIA